MKSIFKVLAVLLGVQLAVGLGFYGYGRTLPETHHEELVIDLARPADQVWALITDYPAMPTWWPEVKSVEMGKLPDGREVTWNMDSHGQKMGFITKASTKPKTLVREIYQDPAHPKAWGGTWTFSLSSPAKGQTRLVVAEDQWVKPPFFRALIKLVYGHRKTLESFEKALKDKLS